MNFSKVVAECLKAIESRYPQARKDWLGCERYFTNKLSYRRVSKARLKEVHAFIRSMGAPLSVTKSIKGEGFMYDGKHICALRAPTSNILHETAHWLLASPSRRKLPEYGLGAGPDTCDSDSADSVAVSNLKISREGLGGYTDEEVMASLLGILFEKKLGLDFEITFSVHCWIQNSCDHKKFCLDVKKGLADLKERGLLKLL